MGFRDLENNLYFGYSHVLIYSLDRSKVGTVAEPVCYKARVNEGILMVSDSEMKKTLYNLF